jgi:type VI secretion system secreted protein VgrG
MAENPTQDDRIGALATPLGKDALVLGRFEGTEGLGEMFEYRIEAQSAQDDIDFNAAIGLNSSVHLQTADGVGRDFSGVLVETQRLGKSGDLTTYKLVLRPWLWLLSLTSDCKIFASMTPKDIILKVFQDRGFPDVRDASIGSYPTLEYCVQYRETDLNFVLRLMEEYGLYYFFEYEQGAGASPTKHTLVLADSASGHKPVPGVAAVPYLPVAGYDRRDKQQFDDWTKNRAIQSGVFKLNDYDYEKPGANLLGDAEHPGGYAHGSMEIYDYPGRYDEQSEGNTLAKVLLDADQAKDQRRIAFGNAPSLAPGFTFNRSSVDGSDPEDGNYLVLGCTHDYGYQTYVSSGDSGSGGETYTGSYELSKSDRQFRMPLRTRKPAIYSSQTAKVVGKEGEEIDVDKEGRIIVEFFWDRKKKASRRVRVAQQWAGKRHGFAFIPRIGDEVVVNYLEGDPDRPLVVGSVYNGDNPISLKLPADKTHSGILTKSSKNSDGYNMLLFDDEAGEERVKLRAQRDLMFKALGNEQRDIYGSQTENIGGDETITVGGPKGGGNFTVNAAKSITLNVGPGGAFCSIVMDATGITLTAGISVIMIQPSNITLTSPLINLAASASVNFVSPMVNIPTVTIGAGTASGLPLI